MQKKIIFLFLIFTYSYLLKNLNAQLVIVPLPFYAPDTGAGISGKLFFIDSSQSFFLDSLSFLTTEEQMGAFNKIGFKKIPGMEKFYCELNLGGISSKTKFYGIGNHTLKSEETKYKHQYYYVSGKFGFKPFPALKTYLYLSHREDRLLDFEDPNGFHTSIFNSLQNNILLANSFGAGFVIQAIDNPVLKKKGIKLNYEYKLASPDFLSSDYSYHQTNVSFAFYLPFSSYLTHATNFSYTQSSGLPFFRLPRLKVRGIGNTIHRDNISFVIMNEERIYISKNWILTGFFDIGKVQSYEGDALFEDIHAGYGGGIRYVIQNILLVRLDIGFSKGGESAVIFNYGHSF